MPLGRVDGVQSGGTRRRVERRWRGDRVQEERRVSYDECAASRGQECVRGPPAIRSVGRRVCRAVGLLGPLVKDLEL